MKALPFSYHRTIRFRDTDAAGVVYFANVLSICHEAYEASLQSAGITLNQFFSDRHRAIPIVHADVDFFQPMICGETYIIVLTPQLLKASEFSVTYTIYAATPVDLPSSDSPSSDSPSSTEIATKQGAIAQAITRHVCIDPNQRVRLDLDSTMHQWLKQMVSVDIQPNNQEK